MYRSERITEYASDVASMYRIAADIQSSHERIEGSQSRLDKGGLSEAHTEYVKGFIQDEAQYAQKTYNEAVEMYGDKFKSVLAHAMTL